MKLNKECSEIHMNNSKIEFEGISLEVESFDRKSGSNHVMPIFFEEQPTTWELLKGDIFDCLTRKGAKTILDVGCGSGFWSILLKKKFPDANVKGIDINPVAIDFSRNNAARNEIGVEFHLVKFDCQYAQQSRKNYDMIVLAPPYHIYPKEKEGLIPFFARGGPTGQDEFLRQVTYALKLISESGFIVFNMMCVGDELFPNYVHNLKEIHPQLSLTYTNILPPCPTLDFLSGVYPEEEDSIFVSALARKFPSLYYTCGIIKLETEKFLVEEHNPKLDIQRGWNDRIELHREINKFEKQS